MYSAMFDLELEKKGEGGGYNFRQENTEHWLTKITPALQAI